MSYLSREWFLANEQRKRDQTTPSLSHCHPTSHHMANGQELPPSPDGTPVMMQTNGEGDPRKTSTASTTSHGWLKALANLLNL